MNKIRFESPGVYLPETIVTTKELIGRMKNPPTFDLKGLTGISNRRWRSETDDSFTLAAHAAKKCLNKSNYKPDDIDAILFCSITRFKDGMSYWLEPGMSGMPKQELGLRESAIGFDITNALRRHVDRHISTLQHDKVRSRQERHGVKRRMHYHYSGNRGKRDQGSDRRSIRLAHRGRFGRGGYPG